jgi:hypothetical protein
VSPKAFAGWVCWSDGPWTQLSDGESLSVVLYKMVTDVELARERQGRPAPTTVVVGPRGRPPADGVALPAPRPSGRKHRAAEVRGREGPGR